MPLLLTRENGAAQLEDTPDLATLYRLWCAASLKIGGNVPIRPMLDPCDLPRSLLPLMFIYEREGERFRCRLAGTRQREVFGVPMDGRYMDEIIKPDAYPQRHALFATALDDATPLLYSTFLAAPGKEWRYIKLLLLPMRRHASEPPTQVMGATHFTSPPRGLRINPDNPTGQVTLHPLDD